MKLRRTFLLCCVALVCAAAPAFAQITKVIDDSEPPPVDPPDPTCVIDIQPGLCPNILDLAKTTNTDDAIVAGSDVLVPGACGEYAGPARSMVMVAILGSATVNVADIDIASIHLAGVSPKGYSFKSIAMSVEGNP